MIYGDEWILCPRCGGQFGLTAQWKHCVACGWRTAAPQQTSLRNALSDMVANSDWSSALEYLDSPRNAPSGESAGPVLTTDIVDIVAADAGEDDVTAWIAVFRLRDGRFVFLSASCGNSGWDCCGRGNAHVASSLDDLLRWAMPNDAVDRLQDQINEWRYRTDG